MPWPADDRLPVLDLDVEGPIAMLDRRIRVHRRARLADILTSDD